ncbi:MAG: transposase [Chitinophagaceae bacterium]
MLSKLHGAHCRVANTSKGFKQWLTWALSFGKKEELHVVMEHTGYYSYQFELFLQDQQIAYTKVNALEIKRSSGLVRGKNDKTDAMMISFYGWLRREQLKAEKMPAAVITELKDFISLRDKLVRDRSGYKARVREQNATRKYAKSHLQNKLQMRKIKELTEDIKLVEKAMKQLIKQHAELQNNYDLLVSIKGIGFVIAAYMLAYTANFTKFNDSSKFNCYAGSSPL